MNKKQPKFEGKLKGVRESGGNIFFDPETWKDLITVGRNYTEAGLKTFGEWSSQIIADVGDTVKPYLPYIWKELKEGKAEIVQPERETLPGKVSAEPAVEAAKTQTRPSEWGANNTDITRETYQQMIERRKKEKGKLKGGREAGGTIFFDSQEWSDLLTAGRFHFEAGARALGDWAGRMLEDFGDDVEPYLPYIWKELQEKWSDITKDGNVDIIQPEKESLATLKEEGQSQETMKDKAAVAPTTGATSEVETRFRYDDDERRSLTMNGKQKLVLWAGIVIIVLMCLFPPWLRVIEIGGSRNINRYGYCFLFDPPEPLKLLIKLKKPIIPESGVFGSPKIGYTDTEAFAFLIYGYEEIVPGCFSGDYVMVNSQRLGIQCVIAALLTFGLLCTFTTKTKYKHKEQNGTSEIPTAVNWKNAFRRITLICSILAVIAGIIIGGQIATGKVNNARDRLQKFETNKLEESFQKSKVEKKGGLFADLVEQMQQEKQESRENLEERRLKMALIAQPLTIVFGGAVGFTGVWFVYLILKWLVSWISCLVLWVGRGFYDDDTEKG